MTIASAEVPTTPEAPKPSTTLAGALIRARLAMRGAVYKNAYNNAPNAGYAYVSHEQIIIAARTALLDNGLLLEQRACRFARESQYEVKGGYKRIVWHWVATFALVHESGEERPYEFEGTTIAGDKAAYAASTNIDKQAHMRVLQLAGTETDDVEHPDNDRREQRDEPRPPGGHAPAHGRREDRTADPPASNVRRLPEPQQRLSAEAETIMQMFGPKLTRLQTQAELRGWWADVVRGRFERPIMEVLWRMFAHHARNVGHDPLKIVPPKGGR